MDKLIEQLEHTATLWSDMIKQMPITTVSLAPLVKTWSGIIEEQIEFYSREMNIKLKQFKTRPFWNDNITPAQAMESMSEAEDFLTTELEELAKKSSLCQTFDFPLLVKAAKECAEEMVKDLSEMKKVWKACQLLCTPCSISYICAYS